MAWVRRGCPARQALLRPISELRVAGAKHLAHAARAHRRSDLVDADTCGGSEGQTAGSIAVDPRGHDLILRGGVVDRCPGARPPEAPSRPTDAISTEDIVSVYERPGKDGIGFGRPSASSAATASKSARTRARGTPRGCPPWISEFMNDHRAGRGIRRDNRVLQAVIRESLATIPAECGSIADNNYAPVHSWPCG
jgi:hypothetical protein